MKMRSPPDVPKEQPPDASQQLYRISPLPQQDSAPPHNSEPHFHLQVPPPRSHNRSPQKLARSHLHSSSRSPSYAATLTAPPMMRARSLPNPATTTTSAVSDLSQLRTTSYTAEGIDGLSVKRVNCLRGPPSPRTRSPYRSDDGPAYQPPMLSLAWQEPHTAFAPSHISGIEAIQEDRELDFSSPNYPAPTLQHPSPYPLRSSSLRSITGSSRRPISPVPSTTTNFNEPFPSSTASSTQSLYTNSHPSTPTSFRSRSPSISSLDPIEDAPEEQELESEAETQAALESLRLSLREREKESDGESDSESSDNGRSRRRRVTDGIKGAITGKKRWSVCGAERRGDLDLETIWED